MHYLYAARAELLRSLTFAAAASTRKCVVQVSKMTTVRDLLVMARHGLVPGKLAYISRRTGTPIYMILLYGIVCGGSGLSD